MRWYIDDKRKHWSQVKSEKKMVIYLACCGPTFPGSCALLAVIWKSAIDPDSIPNALVQVAVTKTTKKIH